MIMALVSASWLLTAQVQAPAPPITQALDSVRIERLAALGRLWYAARLFHPYLAYRAIDWDSALVAAIPRVSAARSADEYAKAVQRMLDALGDPATHVKGKEVDGKASVSEPHPRFSWTADSILIITATNYVDLQDWVRSIAKFDSLAQLVPRSRGVVLDLRQQVGGGAAVNFILSQSVLLWRLFTTPLAAPGQRSRFHSGYRGDAPGGATFYYSAWATQDGDIFSPPALAVSKPAAFIVNERSEVPPAVLALQAGGRAALVIEGAATDASLVSTTSMSVSDSVKIQLRLSELVYPDGTGGLPADTVLPAPAAGAPDGPLDAALNLIRHPVLGHRARTPLPARAAPRPQRAYAEMTYPSLPYRLLAAFRIWGTFEYFHAYRHLYDDDWYGVLKAEIPKFEAARDSVEYALAVSEMVSHVHDTHAFIVAPVLRSYWGEATAPLLVRIVEGVPVITGFTNDSVARAAGAVIGDVIVRVDGEPATTRLARRERYIAASTPQSLHWTAARSLLAGPEGSIAILQVRDGSGLLREIRLPRHRAFRPTCYGCRTGEMLRILPGNVGYADLDRLPASLVDSMFQLFRNTHSIIFDMRGYPQGTAWSIAPRLADRSEPAAAQFRRPVAMEPRPTLAGDANDELTLSFVVHLSSTSESRYHGRTVMLVDERTISQAEYTGQFFEAANGTKFIGSPTAGADGDVTNFVVPGGMSINFSGHDVRYADGRQTQRVGLKPDVSVTPTIAGIRAGRDEVLDAAMAYLRR